MLNKSVSCSSPFLMILVRVFLVQVRKTWLVLGKQVGWLLLPLSSFAPLLCLYSCKYESQSFWIVWSRWAVLMGTRQFFHISVFLSAHAKLSLFIVAEQGKNSALKLSFVVAESWQSLRDWAVLRICCIVIVWFDQNTKMLSVACMNEALQHSSACLPWVGVANLGLLSYVQLTGGSGVTFTAELYSIRLK